MSCRHTATTNSDAYGYTGSVARHPFTHENRAAHGGVKFVETCSACGARRPRNENGRHVEYGTWGDSLAQRQREAKTARELARRAIAAIEPLRLTRSEGSSCVVTVDREGMICLDGASWQQVESTVRAQRAWMHQAWEARKLAQAAERAEWEV